MFVGMLIVPAALDVAITALALLSLAFAPPSLVGIVKSAVQLVTLSILSAGWRAGSLATRTGCRLGLTHLVRDVRHLSLSFVSKT